MSEKSLFVNPQENHGEYTQTVFNFALLSHAQPSASFFDYEHFLFIRQPGISLD